MKLIALSLILAISVTVYSIAEAAGTSKKCYNCYKFGGCKNPPTQQCPSDSHRNFGCISVKIPALGLYQIVQGCTLPDSPEINQLCDAVKAMKGGSCKMCTTNLCNAN